MINLEGVYNSGAVRTLFSRWNGDTTANGWAVGVTSAKSRFEPNLLIVQAVGGDFQDAQMSEVLNSGLKILSEKPYYVSVSFVNKPLEGEAAGGHIIFRVKDLSDASAAMQVSKIPHSLERDYVNNRFQLTLGGRSASSGNEWFGAIHRATLTDGVLAESEQTFQPGNHARHLPRRERLYQFGKQNLFLVEGSGFRGEIGQSPARPKPLAISFTPSSTPTNSSTCHDSHTTKNSPPAVIS